MKNRKKFIYIISIIVLIVFAVGVIIIMQNNITVTAYKNILYNENEKGIQKYVIDLKNRKIKKILIYNSKEVAENEYLNYENINMYLSENNKIDVSKKGKKIIFNISFNKFLEEVFLDINDINSTTYVIDYLEEKGFTVKTSLGAKAYFKYYQKTLEETVENESNKESEQYKDYYKAFIKMIWGTIEEKDLTGN